MWILTFTANGVVRTTRFETKHEAESFLDVFCEKITDAKIYWLDKPEN